MADSLERGLDGVLLVNRRLEPDFPGSTQVLARPPSASTLATPISTVTCTIHRTVRIDPTGLADWDFKVQGVDLKALKDLVVGYYFELKLTVPQVKNKLYIILSEDEKWGIGTEGKVGTLESIYRVDVQGPLSTGVDKVDYTQLGKAGDSAVFGEKGQEDVRLSASGEGTEMVWKIER